MVSRPRTFGKTPELRNQKVFSYSYTMKEFCQLEVEAAETLLLLKSLKEKQVFHGFRFCQKRIPDWGCRGRRSAISVPPESEPLIAKNPIMENSCLSPKTPLIFSDNCVGYNTQGGKVELFSTLGSPVSDSSDCPPKSSKKMELLKIELTELSREKEVLKQEIKKVKVHCDGLKAEKQMKQDELMKFQKHESGIGCEVDDKAVISTEPSIVMRPTFKGVNAAVGVGPSRPMAAVATPVAQAYGYQKCMGGAEMNSHATPVAQAYGYEKCLGGAEMNSLMRIHRDSTYPRQHPVFDLGQRSKLLTQTRKMRREIAKERFSKKLMLGSSFLR